MKCVFCILMIPFVAGLMRGCGSDPGSDDNVQDGWVAFEVDSQGTVNPYGTSESDVKGVFPGCAKPVFNEDNMGLMDTMIQLDLFHDYWYEHRMPFVLHPSVPDTSSVYPYYLCGITQFRTEYGAPIYSFWGLTHEDVIYETYSFVCEDAPPANHSNRAELLLKVCCHELGHQLSKLEHLCNGSNILTQYHDDYDCLMAQGDTAICTGDDLLQYIHFCNICEQNLCTAEGIGIQQ